MTTIILLLGLSITALAQKTPVAQPGSLTAEALEKSEERRLNLSGGDNKGD